ncbi:GL18174, partial [Drosophila persimilis]
DDRDISPTLFHVYVSLDEELVPTPHSLTASATAAAQEERPRMMRRVCEMADISKKYPPPLPIIIQETNVYELLIGSLHLIKCKNGSFDREG